MQRRLMNPDRNTPRQRIDSTRDPLVKRNAITREESKRTQSFSTWHLRRAARHLHIPTHLLKPWAPVQATGPLPSLPLLPSVSSRIHHPGLDLHVLLGSRRLQRATGYAGGPASTVERGAVVQDGAEAARREAQKMSESEWGKVTVARAEGGLTCVGVKHWCRRGCS
jgi:hypothetical protein